MSSAWLATCMLCVCSGNPVAGTNIRVGVVAYQDFRSELERFEQLFAVVSRQNPAMQFRLAVGSYGDVVHWIGEQQIDLAILTPGLFAGVLPPDPGQPASARCRYVATLLLPAARSSWASEQRRQTDFCSDYASVCLISEHSPVKSIEQLRVQAEQGRVELLLVHPVSLSGRVAPLQALRRARFPLEKCRSRFTYSHSQSIRLLSGPPSELTRVAFVWDDASGDDRSLEAGVRRLPFPELEQLKLPHSVIVCRAGFEPFQRIQELLVSSATRQPHYRCQVVADWESRYRAVRRWFQAAEIETPMRDGEPVSLDEIGHVLLQYARAQSQPPRVALVLSGGGARCSYQVGAVAAIEDKFAQLRRDNPECPIDIQLVVGTSGGAINSLPVAIGITRTPEGQAMLGDTWRELDQCDIVRPPLAVRINMGVWFALLQTTLVLWGVNRWVAQPRRRGWTFAAVFTVLAGVEILLGYVTFTPWKWLGSNHLLHHFWLWFSFGVRASAWSLFVLGLAAIGLQAIRARRGDQIRVPTRLRKSLLLSGLIGLPVLQLITVVLFEETLSGGQGMERVLHEKYPRLVNRYLAQTGQPPLANDPQGTAADAIKAASRQIMDRRLLTRDLVITGSCLRQSSEQLPTDLYFYAPAAAHADVSVFGERGISLVNQPGILFDVILGSGSIFPVFPARRIEGIPSAGQYLDLVDGGYAHNSPIEAAVLWGATHILLIDVMSQSRNEGENFLQNIAASVDHLHRQAQLLDTRSRGKVDIFTIAPAPPHLCVIDFADNLVSGSIERGYIDAAVDAAVSSPRFRRELGSPVFVDVAASPLDSADPGADTPADEHAQEGTTDP